MTRIKYLVSISILSIFLSGCSTYKAGTIPDHSPLEIYALAKKRIREGNFKNAIKQLESLDNNYPFEPYSKQVQLDLIYAYYKSVDLSLAQESINRFLDLNPAHPNIDFVIYMRGLVNIALDDSTLQAFLKIDRSDRDSQHAKNAFRDFSQLIQLFPKSQYVYDASKRLISLRERLAKFDLSVVKYYTKCGAYVAAINRAQHMLREYPNTRATLDALPLMAHCYKQLQLSRVSKKIEKFIATNPK